MSSESISATTIRPNNDSDLCRRSKHFIDPQQVRFALTVMYYAVLFPAFFLAVLATITKLQIFLTGKALPQDAFHEILYVEALGFALEHFWLLLGTLAYIGVLTLMFSHRIFGPMRSFESALHDRLENPGEPVNCTLRKKDYFHGFKRLLQETLNMSVSPESASTKSPSPDVR
jgi:hypothetical protein